MRRGGWWVTAAGLAAAVGFALGPATPVHAAAVEPIPVATGPQGCATMEARFGVEPGSWREIRFTHEAGQTSIRPGVLTKTSQGNTITVRLTAEGTVDFTSELPIEAVYVNKGTYPDGAHAIYRYVPPVRADTGLGLQPVVLSGVDHIVLCWAIAPSDTTTTTTTTTTVAPVTSVEVAPTSVPPGPTTTAVVLPTSVAQTTVAVTEVATLPETGGSTELPLAAALAVLVGGALLAASALLGRRAS